MMSGQNDELAIGGALDEGRVGLLSFNESSSNTMS